MVLSEPPHKFICPIAGSRPLTADEQLYYRLLKRGSPEGVTLLEFEPPEGGVPPEIQAQETPEEEEPPTEPPECTDHQPSNFMKGFSRVFPNHGCYNLDRIILSLRTEKQYLQLNSFVRAFR